MNMDFLKSVRFWKLFLVALAEFLGTQNIIPAELAHALAIWLGGSVALRTVDKFNE